MLNWAVKKFKCQVVRISVYITMFMTLIVPTFDTKVTEYLCSRWVFFLQTSFDFLTSHF